MNAELSYLILVGFFIKLKEIINEYLNLTRHKEVAELNSKVLCTYTNSYFKK